ncbi:MAG: hypothetical protein ACTHJT_07700 [Cytophaga sp.]|uniref:hypothetical protein n=1 Tax=Cytophaga sp. TaxID=29535 RepID=UPI003F822ED6
MIYRLTFLSILTVLLQRFSNAQSTYIPLNTGAYQLTDRYEVLSGRIDPAIHSSVKPYNREQTVKFIDSLPQSVKQTKADSFNLNYFRIDSWEWSNAEIANSKKPFLKAFYAKQADAYSVNVKDFDLHINPVMYFMGGNGAGNTQRNYTFMNTRGIEMRGRIAKRIGFYTFFADNQGAFPNYVNQKIDYYTPENSVNPIVPYEAFAKTFKTNGYDFITGRGYITFELVKKYIDLQFGYDKNFIGNGYRSLVLSDAGAPYTFLKLNTHIWKIHYQNIFTQMNMSTGGADVLYPKKYSAFHHLSVNIGKNLNIGLFESIIFGRADSTKNGTYDVSYLNPVIFYRSIEQANGSSDNSLLGLDFKYNFLKHFSFYGQFVIDELVFQEVKSHSGWWGNKQALQLGMKYFNALGIKNLDLQAETNIVRPYMYQHANYYTSYTNFNQPLAHPMGANFVELIGIARYQPLPRLMLQGKMFYTIFGDDSTKTTNTAVSNNGGNINKNYTPIAEANTYGNTIAQGIKTNILFLSLQASYQLRHNLFVDLTYIYRKQTSELVSKNLDTNYISCGVRLNIQPRNYEF